MPARCANKTIRHSLRYARLCEESMNWHAIHPHRFLSRKQRSFEQ
jgi:hypothetical protein